MIRRDFLKHSTLVGFGATEGAGWGGATDALGDALGLRGSTQRPPSQTFTPLQSASARQDWA